MANRLIGPCATFSGGPETIRVDVGALVRRLLLFDTYILDSTRLLEIPRLIEAFGPTGFITLLQSGALKIQCQILTIAVGDSLAKGGREVQPLPPGSISLAMIKPHSEYLHRALQIVHQVDNLTLKQTIKVKKAIVDSLENSPEEVGMESLAATLTDVTKPGLLQIAIARAAQERAVEVRPEALDVRAEHIGRASFMIESNLAKLANLDQERAHQLLVSAVLGIAGANSRVAAMKSHRCLNGVMGDDAAFFGEKLAFLWKEVAPQEQEARFDRVIELVGLPDVSTNAETHRIDVDALLKARQARECVEFRGWLHNLNDLHDHEIVERVRGIKTVMDGLVQSTGGKAMRVLLGAAIGIIPPVGAALGVAAGALDMFVVDRLFVRKGPAVFINEYYQGLFRS